MRPITLTEQEARIIQLAFEIVEAAWEMQHLNGNIKPASTAATTAMQGIRAKIADASTPYWDRRTNGTEDDLGFVPDSKRGD